MQNRIKDVLKNNFEDCNTCEKNEGCEIKDLKKLVEEKLKNHKSHSPGVKEVNFEAIIGGSDGNLTKTLYTLLEKLEKDIAKEIDVGKFIQTTTKLFNSLSPNKKVDSDFIWDSLSGLEKVIVEIQTIKEAIKHLLPKEGIKSGQKK